MNAAIVIAVEQYSEPIEPVPYAAADARAFAAILQQHTFVATHKLLLNEQATKTSIESTIRTTLKQLAANDTLYLFYAGHGFSSAEENYLTSYDTQPADLLDTSIPLAWLFQQLKAAKCKGIALFLDVNHGSFFADQAGRALNSNELELSVKSANDSVCFLSCQAEQTSHGSPVLQQGIWSHHLQEAFEGHAPDALTGNLLTAASLQNYLQQAVPLTLRSVQPTAKQMPTMLISKSEDFLLADLTPVFAARKAAEFPQLEQVKDSILLAEASMHVNRLSGFGKGKGHYIPERVGSREQAFINEAAAEDLTEDIEQIRVALKQAFNFTRRELKTENQGDGGATISTPYFNYNINIFQDATDPSKVVWRRSVDAIIAPEKVLSNEFETVFAKVFDTVQLSLHEKIDLDDLIDSIEALRSNAIRVDYNEDEHVTSCTVTIHGHDAAIKISGNTFSVMQRKATSPKRLLKSLFEVQHALTNTHHVLALRFKGQAD